MGLNTPITKIIACAQGRTPSTKMTDELRVQKENVSSARRTDYIQGIELCLSITIQRKLT